MVDAGATFDRAHVYRYRLWRVWTPEAPRVCFVMLNPSTADATRDDPTIRRCAGFARRWGFGGVEIVNLFAFRATHPAELLRAADPVGPENDRYLGDAIARCARTVAAWGIHGGFRDRDRLVAGLLPASALCLGVTASGCPRHPLYLSAGTQAIEFRFQERGDLSACVP